MLFKLTIPRDDKLVPAVRQIAERVAQCAGFASADAQAVASSIGRAVEIVLASGLDDSLDIQFERSALYLDAWVRYRAGAGDRPVDPVLASEALGPGMDSAEFGREGEVAFCRLRRALPHEKVDHQCEVPPNAR